MLGGDAGNDNLHGGAGADKVEGGTGNDVIVGGPGADVLSGGPGNDDINGHDGYIDHITCGPGADKAFVDANDVVSSDCEHVHRAHKHHH